jgi:hypothetical protein
LAENLSTKQLNNGVQIKQAKSAKEWTELFVNQEPVWCYDEFDESRQKFGVIYNLQSF